MSLVAVIVLMALFLISFYQQRSGAHAHLPTGTQPFHYCLALCVMNTAARNSICLAQEGKF